MPPSRLSSRFRYDAVAAVGVALVALAAAWRALAPFGARFRDHLAPNLQDPLFNTYLLAWGDHQIALGLPDFWNAGFYFPEPRVVALSDHLFGPAALAWILGKLGLGPVAVYNLLVLASFPIAAATVFALLRRAGLRPASAALGSWAFAFAPFRWMHLEHLPVLWMPALALSLWAWDRLLEKPTPGRAATFVAIYAVHFSGGLYLAYMIHLPLAAIAWVRWNGWSRQLRVARARWSLLGAAVGAGVVAAITFLPYVEAGARGFRRTAGEMATWGATLASFLTPSRLDRYFPQALEQFYRFENALFPGIAIALAGFVLVVKVAPRARERLAHLRWPPLFAAGLALAAVALALGDLATWTDRESVTFLGIALRIRGYSRPALMLGLGLVAILSSLGASPLASRRQRSPRSRLRRALLLQGVVAAALCLPIVSAPLARFVPGLIGLRVPSRFAVLALLAGAAGLGSVATLVARRLAPRRRGPLLLGAGLVLLLPEMWPRPVEWQFVGRQENFPSVYRELARRGLEGAVVELPFAKGDLRSDLLRMWRSTLNWNPTSAGYSGYEPAGCRELRDLVARESPARSVPRFRMLGFHYLILHLDELDLGEREASERSWSDAVAAEGGEQLWSDADTRLLALGPGRGEER